MIEIPEYVDLNATLALLNSKKRKTADTSTIPRGSPSSNGGFVQMLPSVGDDESFKDPAHNLCVPCDYSPKERRHTNVPGW